MTEPAPLSVHVSLHAGLIEVDSTGEHPVGAIVEAVDPADRRSVELAAQARIDNDGRRLSVDVQGRARRSSTRVRVRVSVPPYSSVVTRTGEVTLTSVGDLQDVHVRTGDGDIRVPSARGKVDVKAGNASLEIGTAHAVTFVSGRGTLRVTSAADVSLKTGHGQADLQRTTGQVVVKGGGVALSVHEAASGAVSFDAAAGSARVGVTPGTSVHVDLSSGAGEVRCDLPLADTAPSGGADLRLRLRTGSGDVVVSPA